MNLLRAATLVTASVKDACARYGEWLDYTVVEAGTVPADLAASWGAPASAGRLYAVLQPASGADIFLRFVEGDPVVDYEPLRTFGWAAIELCNQDVLRVNERMLRSPFQIIGPPKLIEGLPTIHPMQVKGADDEIVYLTEIKDLSEGSGLPKPQSLIDHLFILVLACSDMEASGRWFCDRLRLSLDPAMSIVYTLINQSFGLVETTTHRLATARYQDDVFLEFDAYPEGALPRPRRDGELPPGVALCTLAHPEFDLLDLPWIVPPQRREGAVYGNRRAGTIMGPDGALMEIVER